MAEYAAKDDKDVHPVNRLLSENVGYQEAEEGHLRRGPRIGPTHLVSGRPILGRFAVTGAHCCVQNVFVVSGFVRSFVEVPGSYFRIA